MSVDVRANEASLADMESLLRSSEVWLTPVWYQEPSTEEVERLMARVRSWSQDAAEAPAIVDRLVKQTPSSSWARMSIDPILLKPAVVRELVLVAAGNRDTDHQAAK